MVLTLPKTHQTICSTHGIHDQDLWGPVQHAEADAVAHVEAELQRYLKAAKLRAIEKLLWGSFNTFEARESALAPSQGVCPKQPVAAHTGAGMLQAVHVSQPDNRRVYSLTSPAHSIMSQKATGHI